MILGHHRPDIIHITETNTGKLSSVLENHLVLGSIDYCPLKIFVNKILSFKKDTGVIIIFLQNVFIETPVSLFYCRYQCTVLMLLLCINEHPISRSIWDTRMRSRTSQWLTLGSTWPSSIRASSGTFSQCQRKGKSRIFRRREKLFLVWKWKDMVLLRCQAITGKRSCWVGNISSFSDC